VIAVGFIRRRAKTEILHFNMTIYMGFSMLYETQSGIIIIIIIIIIILLIN